MHAKFRRWLLVALLVGAGVMAARVLPAAEAAAQGGGATVADGKKLADAVSQLEDAFLAKIEAAAEPKAVCDEYEAQLRQLMRENPGQPEPWLGMTELFEKCEPARALRILDEGLARPDLPEKVRSAYAALRRTAGLVGAPPGLTLTTLEGRPVRFEELRGKVVVVDFWATWCGPCVRDLPKLEALYQKHKDDGLVVVGVSFDRERAKLDAFLKQRGLPWAQTFPNAEEREKLLQATGVSGGYLPTMFLIGRDGRLRHTLDARFRCADKVAALLREK